MADTCVWTCYKRYGFPAMRLKQSLILRVWRRCPCLTHVTLLINPVNYLCYLCVSCNKLQAIRLATLSTLLPSSVALLLMRVMPLLPSLKVKDCHDANSCVNSGQNRNANCAFCYRPNSRTYERWMRVCVCVCVLLCADVCMATSKAPRKTLDKAKWQPF